MLVKEYLYQSELTERQLADILGYKTTGPVEKRMEQELPSNWVEKIDNWVFEQEVDKIGKPEEKSSDQDDWINTEGRADDKDPNIDNFSNVEVIGPQKIKLTTIQGYIEMIYGGAETIARARGDVIAAETISQYTPQYVEAWIDYIKYDERILKYLEMFQIGTPLGNLVGIHAISIGAYALARITAKELAANAAANGNGEVEI